MRLRDCICDLFLQYILETNSTSHSLKKRFYNLYCTMIGDYLRVVLWSPFSDNYCTFYHLIQRSPAEFWSNFRDHPYRSVYQDLLNVIISGLLKKFTLYNGSIQISFRLLFQGSDERGKDWANAFSEKVHYWRDGKSQFCQNVSSMWYCMVQSYWQKIWLLVFYLIQATSLFKMNIQVCGSKRQGHINFILDDFNDFILKA